MAPAEELLEIFLPLFFCRPRADILSLTSAQITAKLSPLTASKVLT